MASVDRSGKWPAEEGARGRKERRGGQARRRASAAAAAVSASRDRRGGEREDGRPEDAARVFLR